jgi:ribose 5-phosphate isomerase A
MDLEVLKKMAALKSVEFVESGDLVGLGTGSTAKYAVEELGRKMQQEGFVVKGTPTSIATTELAENLGIELVDLENIQAAEIAVDIDGADQILLDTGDCLKGGGGAHYWEKKVALKSRKVVVIVDETKVVDSLAGYKVALEVSESMKAEAVEDLNVLGLDPIFREKKSDSGNLVADVIYDGKMLLAEFEKSLLSVRGVLDTGIFIGIVTDVVVAKSNGEIEVVNIKK